MASWIRIPEQRSESFARRRGKEIIAKVYENGIFPHAVPKLLETFEELEHERLGPQEGFVLSRINGELDVASIVSVCPFREATVCG